MSLILSLLIDGIAYGVILFMIAVGLAVTLGLMRVINLAHGGFVLLGGALASWLTMQGFSYWLALVAAVAGTVAVALPMERLLYRRIYGFSELAQVLATIGITFLIIASINLIFGSAILPIRLPPALQGSVDLGFRTLPAHRLFVIAAGLAVVVALYWLTERTRFGVRLRATMDNRKAAAALGVDTGALYTATFCLAAGLAALGGILGAELLPVEAYYPLRHMALFLIVVAVGGMGSIAGSFAAAIALGIIDTITRYFAPDLGSTPYFLLVIALLSLRPNGLLGRA